MKDSLTLGSSQEVLMASLKIDNSFHTAQGMFSNATKPLASTVLGWGSSVHLSNIEATEYN